MQSIGRTLRLAGWSVIVIIAIAGPAFAQASASVTGSVKDSQGGVIPGATVILTSQTRGTATEAVVTNLSGDFVVPNLLADTYTVRVEMPSFKTAVVKDLVVAAQTRVSA